MRDGKDESESVRWPLRQGAGNRARLPRHASRHRVRPGRRRNCCRERSRQAPAWWCGPAVRSSGACCARTARKRAFGTAEQPVLGVLTLASCGGKRARKKHNVTLGIRAARLVPPGDRTGDAPLSAVSVVGPQDLDWLLLTTEGQPEKANAVRKWYERRWTECFKALKRASKTGGSTTTSESALPSTPSPLAECFTACRVLQRMAGRTLRPPKTKTKSLCLPACSMAKSRAPPKNLDARTFVLDVARLAGFHSTPTVARNHLARLRLPQILH